MEIPQSFTQAFADREDEIKRMTEILKIRMEQLKTVGETAEVKKLEVENATLKVQVEKAKKKLRDAEVANGKEQIPLPGDNGYVPPSGEKKKVVPANVSKEIPEKPKKEGSKQEESKGKKKSEKKATPAASSKNATPVVDVSRLQLMVARIVSAKKHPDADSLYVEDVETGEPENRVVISGLAGKVPLEEMQDRMVVICANLKPSSMRGIKSHAMVMCASEEGKVEVLVPPPGSVPGDRVIVEGYFGPDKMPDKQLNPKRKVFEQVQPDLKTDAKCVATYKGIPWTVEGKPGFIKAQTMANSSIK